MDDKLKAWLERMNQPPSQPPFDNEEFWELLTECRIVEGGIGT